MLKRGEVVEKGRRGRGWTEVFQVVQVLQVLQVLASGPVGQERIVFGSWTIDLSLEARNP